MFDFKLLYTDFRKTAGFTLVEMIVAFTIFIIVSGVVIFDARGSRRVFEAKNMAYDISFLLYKAQRLGVTTAITSSSSDLASRIGLKVTVSNGSGGVPAGEVNGFTLYKNNHGTFGYNPAVNVDDIIDQFTLSNRGEVHVRMCTFVDTTADSCTQHTSEVSFEFVRQSKDILEPDFNGAAPFSTGSLNFQVQVGQGASSVYRYVTLTRTGFISVY